MRRALAASAVLAALALSACGPTTHQKTTLPPSVKHACPQALDGKEGMGACNPNAAVTAPLAAARASSVATSGITFPDFSNNDPCYCGPQLRAHGHAGVIAKANQGTGFIDSTFTAIIASARAAHLAVGGYDFDQWYTAAEAYTFVNRLHAAGIYKNTASTFPPTLDVEFGVPSRPGLEHQLAVLQREYGRAQIYTGAWYWLPHFGCWTPPHVVFWLSGYPVASLLCSLSPGLWASHQFTDHGYTGASQVPFADLSVFRGNASQWAVYVHQAKPQPTRRQRQAQLWHLYRERTGVQAKVATLSALLTKHGCRPPHHAHPRSYHRRACPAWKAEGDASHTHLGQVARAIATEKALIRKAR